MLLELKNEELKNLLIKEGFPADKIVLPDEFYAIPTLESIKEFGNRLYDFLVNNGLSTWKEDSFDCDDFAFTAKSLASIDNALWQSKTGNTDASLTFGIAFVLTEYGRHAINISVLKEGDKFVIKYLEPQIINKGLNRLCLTEIERKSLLEVYWCYF